MSDAAQARGSSSRAEAVEAQLAQLRDQLNAIENNIQTTSRIDHYRVPKPRFPKSIQLCDSFRSKSLKKCPNYGKSTKADTVLAVLDVELLGCVRDIITISPAPANIYEQVKA